jgi:predicted amidohydrolase YtcJ
MLTGADLILFNGKIVTVDQDFSIHEAIAVVDGRIAAVGSNEDISKFQIPRTKRIDLKGRTVIPGLIDTHPHLDTWRGYYRSLAGCTSIPEVLERVADAAAQTGTGQWLLFHKFAEPDSKAPGVYKEGRFPNRYELDRVAPNNPVWLRGGYLTPSVLNSAALELAGITRETPQPRQLVPSLDWRTGDMVPSPGGYIEKDPETGEPTGVLADGNDILSRTVTSNFYHLVPQPDYNGYLKNIEARSLEFSSLGITSIYEGHGLADPADRNARAFLDARSRDKLTVRTQIATNIQTFGTLQDIIARLDRLPHVAYRGAGDDWLRFVGVSVTLDGACGCLDCVQQKLLQWKGKRSGVNRNGIARVPEEKYRTLVREATRRGIRVTTKADGEAMIDQVLKIYGEMDAEFGIRDRRFVMMHSAFAHPERQMPRLKELGILPTTCISFLWNHGMNMVRAYGKDLIHRAVPYRSWLRAGIRVSNGTDAYPWNPFLSLWAMITRTDGETGIQLGADECVTREQALRVYTENGAHLLQMEDRLGSLEPGKYADFLVLSDDYLGVAEEEIQFIKPLLTVVGGRIVYEAPQFEGSQAGVQAGSLISDPGT